MINFPPIQLNDFARSIALFVTLATTSFTFTFFAIVDNWRSKDDRIKPIIAATLGMFLLLVSMDFRKFDDPYFPVVEPNIDYWNQNIVNETLRNVIIPIAGSYAKWGILLAIGLIGAGAI